MKPLPRISTSNLARMFSRVFVVPISGCWLWCGPVNSSGYANFGSGPHATCEGAHRVAYRWFVGDIPSGFQIDHLCKVRNCLNPAHMEAVTYRVNNERKRRRTPRQVCSKGHTFSGANLLIKTVRGIKTQVCRECRRASWRAVYQRKKGKLAEAGIA